MALRDTRTVLRALADLEGVADRGYSFVDGHGHETYVSFSELVRAVQLRSGALQALGLVAGQRLAVIVPDQREFVLSFLGALAARLVPVPLYPPASLGTLDAWLETTGSSLRAARVAAIVTVAEVRGLLWSTAARTGARLWTCDEVVAAAREAPLPTDVQPQDLAFLQFTSGSTGAPRGVMVSHGNIATNGRIIMDELLQGAKQDKGLSWLPLYHDMGLIGFVLAPLFNARPVVFLATLAFLKKPSLWFELIHRHRATVTFAPNFGYSLAARRIAAADLARWDLSCVRVAGCGGEPVSPETLRAFAERFAVAGLRAEALLPCYGMAETTLVASFSRAGRPWRSERVDPQRLRAAGRALPVAPELPGVEVVACGAPPPGHEVRALDAHGKPLPERTVGQLEVRGPSVTLGYFEDHAATADAYREGGLRTGDLGYLADGDVFVTGRSKDIIIVHGRNYEPQAIESCLGTLAEVRRGNVAAFGRPDPQGEAVVVACEAATRAHAAVQRAVRSRVYDELGLSVADVVVLPPGTLPKTSSGKVQRARTRALYLEGQLQQVAAARRRAGRPGLVRFVRLRWRSLLGRLEYALRRGSTRAAVGTPSDGSP